MIDVSKYDLTNIKAVALDLDGTTLNDQRVWSSYTAKVVNALIKKDIQVIIATGRGIHGIGMVTEKLTEPCSFVLLNGAIIIDHGQEPVQRPIKDRYFKKLEQIDIPEDILVNYYSYDTWYSTEADEQKVYATMLSRAPFVHASIAEAPADKVLVAFLVDPTGESDRLQKIKEQIETLCSGELHVTFSEKNGLSITNQFVTKLSSIRFLLGDYTPEGNMIAFGDNLNDLEMLTHSKYGFYMKSDIPHVVKTFAKFPALTPMNSNCDSSPARVLNDLFNLGIPYEGEDK